MRARYGFILILPALLFAFQNCSRAAQPSVDQDPQTDSQGQTVIGATAQYRKISYDPYTASNSPVVHLDIDVQAGSLSATVDGAVHTCALDSDRLAVVRTIMAESRICEPGPLPPGMVSCLALGLADIQLSNDSSGVMLRPVICHSGTFLCDGNDAKLRALLNDLSTNPPSGCQ